MKVMKIDGHEGIVESGGLRRRANFMLMGDVKAGEYVILHAGFAIERIKPDEARKTLKALKDL
jgi:hydrogenase expression/formation protein HypC